MGNNRRLLSYFVSFWLSTLLCACSLSQPPIIATLTHPNIIANIIWSPDGSMLATTSNTAPDSEKVWLWNTDGMLHATLTLPNSVKGVAWSPNSRTLAVAAFGTTQVWNSDGTLLRTISEHEYTPTCVAWSPDGLRLATGSAGGPLRMWSADGTLLQTLSDRACSLGMLVWSPNGQILASVSDKSVRLWSLDGHIVATIEHPNVVGNVVWSRDSTTLVTTFGNSATFWSATGQPRITIPYAGGGIALLPDGKFFASGSYTNVYFWTSEGQKITTLSAASWPATWSPVSDILAFVSNWKDVRLSRPDGSEQATLTGHTNEITALAWSPDGKILASGSDDKTVRLWRIGS